MQVRKPAHPHPHLIACAGSRSLDCPLSYVPPFRRYPGCVRVFTLPGALHTHTGWHKRKENIQAGVYDRLGHHLKVNLPPFLARTLAAQLIAVYFSRVRAGDSQHV